MQEANIVSSIEYCVKKDKEEQNTETEINNNNIWRRVKKKEDKDEIQKSEIICIEYSVEGIAGRDTRLPSSLFSLLISEF